MNNISFYLCFVFKSDSLFIMSFSYMFFYFVCLRVFFFFFKQKTAYEMRISDWSSDVCSSDLRRRLELLHGFAGQRRQRPVGSLRQPDAAEQLPAAHAVGARGFELAAGNAGKGAAHHLALIGGIGDGERSEERRVGKEWVSTGRYRGSP